MRRYPFRYTTLDVVASADTTVQSMTVYGGGSGRAVRYEGSQIDTISAVTKAHKPMIFEPGLPVSVTRFVEDELAITPPSLVPGQQGRYRNT